MAGGETSARLREIEDAAHSTCLPSFARAERFQNPE